MNTERLTTNHNEKLNKHELHKSEKLKLKIIKNSRLQEEYNKEITRDNRR